MSRIITTGALALDQLDIFFPVQSFTRMRGVLFSGVSVDVFVNNVKLPWSIADGTLVQDSTISSGSVYFNEINTSVGFYSVRFYPDRIGFWRFVYKVPVYGLEVIKEYDIVSPVEPNYSNTMISTLVA